MQHTIPHGLSKELAVTATHKALDAYEARFAEYSPRQTWLGEDRAEIQFTAAGRTLRGSVVVGAKDIGLDLEVPLLFTPFKGRALKIIEEEIRAWIEKARTGQLG